MAALRKRTLAGSAQCRSSATNSSGYAYFTADMAANNGFGSGLGANNLVTWPVANATAVPTNFLSDYESPDPVPNQNEVGYPISVHADLGTVLTVSSFTVRQHGTAADLPNKGEAACATSAGCRYKLVNFEDGSPFDPADRNPNYGSPTSYQSPRTIRMGVRLTF